MTRFRCLAGGYRGRGLPAGQIHRHVSEVWQALGHHVEDDPHRF